MAKGMHEVTLDFPGDENFDQAYPKYSRENCTEEDAIAHAKYEFAYDYFWAWNKKQDFRTMTPESGDFRFPNVGVKEVTRAPNTEQTFDLHIVSRTIYRTTVTLTGSGPIQKPYSLITGNWKDSKGEFSWDRFYEWMSARDHTCNRDEPYLDYTVRH